MDSLISRKRLGVWLTVLPLGALMIACGRGGDSIAVVNGEKVSKEEYYTYLERKNLVRVATNQGAVDANVAEPLGFQALKDMVNRKLLEQLAKDMGVYPTDGDVQKELQFRSSLNPAFVKTLTEQGLSLDMIKNELRIDLCREKVLTKGITVTDAQVEQFIKENPQQFTEPKRVSMLWIVVDNQREQQQVDSELKNGQVFATVAKQFSKAPQARNLAGRFPVDNYNQFPPEIKKIADSVPENGTSQWITIENKRAIFKVEKKLEAKKVSLSAAQKEAVKRQIAMQKGSVSFDLGKRLLEKLKNAKVEISKPGLSTQWKTASENLKQAEAESNRNAAPSLSGDSSVKPQ